MTVIALRRIVPLRWAPSITATIEGEGITIDDAQRGAEAMPFGEYLRLPGIPTELASELRAIVADQRRPAARARTARRIEPGRVDKAEEPEPATMPTAMIIPINAAGERRRRAGRPDRARRA